MKCDSSTHRRYRPTLKTRRFASACLSTGHRWTRPRAPDHVEMQIRNTLRHNNNNTHTHTHTTTQQLNAHNQKTPTTHTSLKNTHIHKKQHTQTNRHTPNSLFSHYRVSKFFTTHENKHIHHMHTYTHRHTKHSHIHIPSHHIPSLPLTNSFTTRVHTAHTHTHSLTHSLTHTRALHECDTNTTHTHTTH